MTLLVLALIALNVFYNLHGMPLSLQYAFALADRCGLLVSANLPLLYLLAAKTQPVKMLTGYSYESLNGFHRRLGELWRWWRGGRGPRGGLGSWLVGRRGW